MADYSTVPQDVLNYFQGYTASPFGSWWDQSKNGRYTDANGYQWMPQWEGASPDGDNGAFGGQLTGYRRGEIAGELNDPFRREATNLYYSPEGKYQFTNTDDPGWLNQWTGPLAVFGAALGMGAIGAAAGGTAAGTGAGLGTGAATGADMSAFYGGLDGGATLGGGASVNGGAALGAGGAGAAGAGTGFMGDATASGYGGLDSASASTMGGGASVDGGASLGGSSAMGAGAAPGGAGGTPPPANPYASGATDWSSMLSNGVQNMGASDWLGLATTALGAYGGAQGQQNAQTTQNKMDPRLDPYIYGSLFPNAQGLMNAQMPIAGQNSAQLTSVGRGLLGTNVNPNLQDNPYLSGAADDMQRRTGNLLGTSLQQIQGNSVGVGGLGGSRQGVAQGEAMKGAADSLQGNLASLYYNQYNADANRNLQKITLGAGLMNSGQQAPWAPMQAASDIYKPYSGLNSAQTVSSNQGGGWMGALGGALGGAQFAKNAFGSGTGGSGGWW